MDVVPERGGELVEAVIGVHEQRLDCSELGVLYSAQTRNLDRTEKPRILRLAAAEEDPDGQDGSGIHGSEVPVGG